MEEADWVEEVDWVQIGWLEEGNSEDTCLESVELVGWWAEQAGFCGLVGGSYMLLGASGLGGLRSSAFWS